MTVVQVFEIFRYLLIIIWFFPPFRQYKGKYFYFFLFLALSQAGGLIFYAFHSGVPWLIFIVFSFLLFCALQEWKKLKKYWYIFFVFFLIIIFIHFILRDRNISEYIFIGLHLIILFRLLQIFIPEIVNGMVINLFLIMMIFYEIIIITKFINYMTGFADAYTYFFITSTFEVILGLFFSIFRADNRRIVFQLK